MVRIPSEYQEVEYLYDNVSSNNKPYINTNVIPNENMRVAVEGITSNDIEHAGFVFGSRTSITNILFYGLIWQNKYQFGLGSKRNQQITSANKNKRFYFDFNNDENHTVIANDISYSPINIPETQKAYTQPMFLFNINTNGSQDFQTTPVKIIKFVVYNHYSDADPIMNLIPCYHKSSGEIGMYDAVSGQFYTNSGTGAFLKGNDVTYDNINLLESRRRILLNTPHIETISDTVASFKTDIATKLKECKIHFTPIQEGEGDPSPENVRLIHGWDGVTVTACGKNLINEAFLQNADNYHIAGAYGYHYTDWIYLTPNTQYKFTWNIFDSDKISDKKVNLFVANANQYIIKNGKYQQYSSFTTKSDGSIRFGIYKESTSVYSFQELLDIIFDNGHLQLELGSTATDYEPYNGTSITIPFPQTIYGGYVDLVKGEVVEEWKSESLGNYKWTAYTTATNISRWRCSNIPIEKLIDSNDVLHGLCDKLLPIAYNSSWSVQYRISPVMNTSTICVILSSMTKEEADSFLETATLCYKLATPNTYQIDPQTLKALRGMNNIWSDANGNIEVSFYTH